MDTVTKNGFCELETFEMYGTNGGGLAEGVVSAVADIWDSWCNMWYEAGRHTYNWLN